ncbi:hypothetical protein AJ79_01804 [Helicocarpus griseus UAMH5409]|uniref:Uncharacterized protein n=1 Tax=Helicocarpus griseus UAMH5409 TaxID=1447875 RepID=A0A2B7Y618_9EURO|nr:hypothetical protein AJ79_01804 [Helicocarpus griseus UAMH5409]
MFQYKRTRTSGHQRFQHVSDAYIDNYFTQFLALCKAKSSEIVIDGNMGPTIRGAHIRSPINGKLNPENQSIFVNMALVNRSVAASANRPLLKRYLF